jgi:hypothetical protein
LDDGTYTNTINCLFTAQDDRSFERTASATCEVLEFSVDIQKECDTKVVQVPGNPDDPIDCTITITNDGPNELTDCTTSDSLTGPLALASTLASGASDSVSTSTDVTADMLAAGTVTNTATVTCTTAFGTASDTVSVDIDVRSVDATVVKTCDPETQLEPGVIDWSWTVENTSPDGSSSLDVSCDGTSTLNPQEIEDALNDVIANGGTSSNLWQTSGLDDGTYTNTISCLFTAQDDRSFERTASATCEVTPNEQFAGCTPGYWKQTQHAWAYPDPPIGFDSTTLKEAGFVTDKVDDSTTVTDALSLKGGKGKFGFGGEGTLLRACAAGLLNSYVLDYPISTQDVLDDCNAAIASGVQGTMLNLAGDIDDDNNGVGFDFEGEWCPLGNGPTSD